MANNIKAFSTKTFQKDGKWVEKPHTSLVVVCVCGGKYIKTRDKQTICIKCMYGATTDQAASLKPL